MQKKTAEPICTKIDGTMVRELWKKQLDFDGLVVIQSHYNDRVGLWLGLGGVN